MELKFYLNKFLKVDNIENYTLSTLMILHNKYDDFLEHSDGTDPDFPLVDFGGKKAKGEKVAGVNKVQKEMEEEERKEIIEREVWNEDDFFVDGLNLTR